MFFISYSTPLFLRPRFTRITFNHTLVEYMWNLNQDQIMVRHKICKWPNSILLLNWSFHKSSLLAPLTDITILVEASHQLQFPFSRSTIWMVSKLYGKFSKIWLASLMRRVNQIGKYSVKFNGLPGSQAVRQTLYITIYEKVCE